MSLSEFQPGARVEGRGYPVECGQASAIICADIFFLEMTFRATPCQRSPRRVDV